MANPPLLAQTLFAEGPHPSLGAHAETYGRVIGSWEGEYRDRRPDGPEATGPMEVHFGWALEGRAVQDVWIAPTLAERARGRQSPRATYGTTLRIFEPAIEAWRVLWFNPASQVRSELIGRRVGDDIVQTGLYGATPIKWNFTEVTARSFTWRGYELDADGVTWTLGTEFLLRRTA